MEQITQHLRADFEYVFGKNMKGKDIQNNLRKFHPDNVHSVDFSCFPSIKSLTFTIQEKAEICTFITRFLLSAKESNNDMNDMNCETKSEHSFKEETVYGWSDYEFVMKSKKVDKIFFIGEVYWTCPSCGGETNDEFTTCQNFMCDFDIKQAFFNSKSKKYLSDEVEKILKTKNFKNFLKHNGKYNMDEDDCKEYYLENVNEFNNYVTSTTNRVKQIKQPKLNTIQHQELFHHSFHIPIISTGSSDSTWDD